MTTLTAREAEELFRQEPHRLLDVGAGEVALRSVGNGPDVLFVHGWPVSGATFRLLLPFLAEQFTCHVIDLPGAGSSRFDDSTRLTVAQHIASVRRVIDLLDVDDVAVVGHDSGGLIARHAIAGDDRVRAVGLIDTEQPAGLNWRFKLFLAARHSPRLAELLGWAAGQRRVRRSSLVFGGAFVDRSLLDGAFDELFLRPLATSAPHQAAAVRVLRSFDSSYVRELPEVHRRIDVPVQLVWGAHDPFFPVAWARAMVSTFPHADLTVIDDASLFCHEERPEEVARALAPALVGVRGRTGS